MDVYDHIIFAAIAAAVALACTKRYRLGLRSLLLLVTIDLTVHIFIQLDILRAIFAALAFISVSGDLAKKEVKELTQKTKLYCGIFFALVGLGILLVQPHPYFLFAGIIIILVTLLDKKSVATLPTMTKGKHWAWVGVSYVAAFALSFAAFMSPVPMIGLFIIPIPALLTVAGIVLYLKNTAQRNKS